MADQDPREMWDQAAEQYDEQPDHGLRDPAVRQAWGRLLAARLPRPPAAVLDTGCGTGSLSVLLSELGYRVTGIDLSPEMIARAQGKAARAGQGADFQVMDAAAPRFPPGQFDAIVCRHVLWTLPEPRDVLRRWASLLKPGGCLLLIEGYWYTGSGMRAQEILSDLPRSVTVSLVETLSDQPELWGGPVTDDRYLILAVCRESENSREPAKGIS